MQGRRRSDLGKLSIGHQAKIVALPISEGVVMALFLVAVRTAAGLKKIICEATDMPRSATRAPGLHLMIIDHETFNYRNFITHVDT